MVFQVLSCLGFPGSAVSSVSFSHEPPRAGAAGGCQPIVGQQAQTPHAPITLRQAEQKVSAGRGGAERAYCHSGF